MGFLQVLVGFLQVPVGIPQVFQSRQFTLFLIILVCIETQTSNQQLQVRLSTSNHATKETMGQGQEPASLRTV